MKQEGLEGHSFWDAWPLKAVGALVAAECRPLCKDGKNENKQLNSSCVYEISDCRMWFCPGGWKGILAHKKENSFKLVKSHQNNRRWSSTAGRGSKMGGASEHPVLQLHICKRKRIRFCLKAAWVTSRVRLLPCLPTLSQPPLLPAIRFHENRCLGWPSPHHSPILWFL